MMAVAASGLTSSSPLARGTLVRSKYPFAYQRFIPARAGNTAGPPGCPPGSSVHPRSRGEHRLHLVREPGHNGSSPLARGTLASATAAPRLRRFIPARAGNTPSGRGRRRRTAVHPRSRGEHGSTEAEGWLSGGSSPLARGTHRVGRRAQPRPRFIPARAGNTGPCTCASSIWPVHPRSRGEHIRRARISMRVSGSSPLARGTQEKPSRHHRPSRFIPARAGNTPRRP